MLGIPDLSPPAQMPRCKLCTPLLGGLSWHCWVLWSQWSHRTEGDHLNSLCLRPSSPFPPCGLCLSLWCLVDLFSTLLLLTA